jgi:hypothetical protein
MGHRLGSGKENFFILMPVVGQAVVGLAKE